MHGLPHDSLCLLRFMKHVESLAIICQVPSLRPGSSLRSFATLVTPGNSIPQGLHCALTSPLAILLIDVWKHLHMVAFDVSWTNFWSKLWILVEDTSHGAAGAEIGDAHVWEIYKASCVLSSLTWSNTQSTSSSQRILSLSQANFTYPRLTINH